MVQINDLEMYMASLNTALDEEIAEKALAGMRRVHKEAKRLFGPGRGGMLRYSRYRTVYERQIDEIIVADSCVMVVKVRRRGMHAWALCHLACGLEIWQLPAGQVGGVVIISGFTCSGVTCLLLRMLLCHGRTACNRRGAIRPSIS